MEDLENDTEGDQFVRLHHKYTHLFEAATMPRVDLLLYREDDGTPPPLVTWLDGLQAEARDRCLARLELLAEHGHNLQRPHAAPLDHGIFELRVKFYRVNYRMLYFFHGRTAVVLSHGFSKQQGRVPAREIRVAVERREKFRRDPEQHAFHPGRG